MILWIITLFSYRFIYRRFHGSSSPNLTKYCRLHRMWNACLCCFQARALIRGRSLAPIRVCWRNLGEFHTKQTCQCIFFHCLISDCSRRKLIRFRDVAPSSTSNCLRSFRHGEYERTDSGAHVKTSEVRLQEDKKFKEDSRQDVQLRSGFVGLCLEIDDA